MPKIVLSFPTEAEIPSNLVPYKTDKNTVEVWVGDKVAEETNPALAKNTQDLLNEKKTIQQQYDSLLPTVTSLRTQVNELNLKIAGGHTITDEEVALLPKVKEIVKKYGTIEEVETKLTEHSEILPKYTEISTKIENDKIFNASGFKNREAFDKILSNPNEMVNIEKMFVENIKDATGNEVATAFANRKKTDGSVEKVALTELAKTDWAYHADKLVQADTSKQWIPQDSSKGLPNIPATQAGAVLNSFVAHQNSKNVPAKQENK